ncbi:uncharacterized protein [Aquarana catesbeiana]|uniref:uncharacterized protein isoform X4 n=1 Tax=Aquarana catesbeiana TaxID=8400 RepID=UPI003CC996A3
MESSLSCVLLVLCGLWSWVCPVPLTIHKTVGANVTLVPQYSADPSEINWKINGNKLVDMELKPRVDIVFYRLRDRATISPTDGILTIWDLTIGDSGVYKAEALVNNVIQEREIKLIVLDENIRPAFTSSTGPPNSSVTSARKGPSFSSSHGLPETKKTKGPSSRSSTHPTRVKPTGMSESQAEGPPSRSTTHPTSVKQTEMSASTRTIIIVVVAGLFVIGVFVGCLIWCFCCGEKRKQTYKTKDLCTVGLLTAVKSEETEVRNNVQPEVKSESSSLDAPGTETEAGNDVKPEEKRSSLDAPTTGDTKAENDVKSEVKRSSLDAPETEETEAGNDVKSEDKRSSLDTPGTEKEKPGNNVQPEEKSSSLDAPGTEPEVGNDVQPEENRSSLDTPGTEETEVGDNVQPEEDEPVTVL